DDEEGKQEKLPTDEELPTFADDEEIDKEEQQDDYVVDLGGSYVHYHRGLDGKLRSREYLAEELISDDALTDEDLQKGEQGKTVDLDTLVAIRDILDADKDPIHVPDFNGARTEEQSPPSSSALKLHFSKSELDRYVEQRKTGLRAKSIDWINRAAQALWDCTRGDISYQTMTALRTFALEKYKSVDSHSKVLSFARAYLSHLAKTRQDTRYQSFNAYLDLPRGLKERKTITSRIVTKDDINNVLRHIKNAEQDGHLTSQKSAQYSAFVVFGAFSGQRSESTMSRLRVGQFRQAIASEKPVLQVESSQDKIKMAHYVPIHHRTIPFLQPLIEGRGDDERMFDYESLLMWIKRQKIPMSRFKGHFVLGDLRKFAEQYGDIIQWEQSNRAYVLTHGVSGVDWRFYKHPLPDSVYDVYTKYWGSVSFKT
ncbi:MAG: hypothetical protein WB946_00875, partial [Halobacteriota archaeon]